MLSLEVLVLFLMLSIYLGKKVWKSRSGPYTALLLFAFLQAMFVLIELFRMKPPLSH